MSATDTADPLTGELALSERGEYYHYEREGECSVCDSIADAFKFSWPSAADFRSAWQHVRLCPVALAACERGRVQLADKAVSNKPEAESTEVTA